MSRCPGPIWPRREKRNPRTMRPSAGRSVANNMRIQFRDTVVVSAAILVAGPGHLAWTAAAQTMSRGPITGVSMVPTIGAGVNSPDRGAFPVSEPSLVPGAALTVPSLPAALILAVPAAVESQALVAAAASPRSGPASSGAALEGEREGAAGLFEAEALLVPRGPLFHQVSPWHSRRLESEIGRVSQEFPPGWESRGRYLWTSQGRPYFEFGLEAKAFGVYILKPRPGWGFVAEKDLELSSERGTGARYSAWLKKQRASGMPPNEFDFKLRRDLKYDRYPSHSAYYRAGGIAGFWVDDYHDRPKRSFVFVHPLGGTVRLLRSALRPRSWSH